MNIEDRDGLRVAVAGTEEALAHDWRAAPPAADVVRVKRPDRARWPELERAGFVVKPGWVNWRAPLGASEEEYLAALPASERRNFRLGRRFAEEQDVEVVVRDGLTAHELDAFLTVYDAQIAAMPHGVAYARRQQEQLWERRAEHVAVYAHRGGTLVAGCLCLVRPAESVLQLRFAAAAPQERQARLQRALYLAAMRAARERRLAVMSLGNDPSLYGHVAGTGLFRFKARSGFTPTPSHLVDPGVGGDEADLFLGLRGLSDPSLLLAYSAPDPAAPLRLLVLTDDGAARAADAPGPDVTQYRADFLAGVALHPVRPAVGDRSR
ncbi:peptidogalycan biosysnthesis protein [Kitasatospora sp. NPDC047058]|uniref:peptidogalycan biosysnthesis protein n=1 Tax=Kitasatospora sp. NPDC047058 TaxID=3155620 RepID=UPI0033F1200F